MVANSFLIGLTALFIKRETMSGAVKLANKHHINSHQNDYPDVNWTRMTKEHSKANVGKATRYQLCTKTHRQQKRAKSRSDLPQGKAHWMVFQGQTVSPDNIHTCNIIWTEQPVFRKIDVYTFTAYMHAVEISKKEAMNLKQSRKECTGGKGREKCFNYIIIWKKRLIGSNYLYQLLLHS